MIQHGRSHDILVGGGFKLYFPYFIFTRKDITGIKLIIKIKHAGSQMQDMYLKVKVNLVD